MIICFSRKEKCIFFLFISLRRKNMSRGNPHTFEDKKKIFKNQLIYPPGNRTKFSLSQGFSRSVVLVLHLWIRFVRQDLACVHSDGIDSWFLRRRQREENEMDQIPRSILQPKHWSRVGYARNVRAKSHRISDPRCSLQQTWIRSDQTDPCITTCNEWFSSLSFFSRSGRTEEYHWRKGYTLAFHWYVKLNVRDTHVSYGNIQNQWPRRQTIILSAG